MSVAIVSKLIVEVQTSMGFAAVRVLDIVEFADFVGKLQEMAEHL